MKRQDVVDVFVASPGELHGERKIVAETIAELNDTWADYIGLRLQLLRRETRSWPAIGEDAQDVINRQIGDDYQILIVIVGAHLGEPTKRSASGTTEEFERACSRQSARARLCRDHGVFQAGVGTESGGSTLPCEC